MKFVRHMYENGKTAVPKEIRSLAGNQSGDLVQIEVVGIVRSAVEKTGAE